jgi:hypothetical protein
VGSLSGLLDHVDEVAGGLALAGGVGLEVAVDTVLTLPVEGSRQDLFEVVNTVRVIGQAEFAAGTQTRGIKMGDHTYSPSQRTKLTNIKLN